jgi:hypothetical protein
MDLGFSLSEYPDADLKVLDLDDDGTIGPMEFIDFFKEGIAHEEATASVPADIIPIDDLLLKEANLDGTITVRVSFGRFLRDVSTWFSPSSMKVVDSSPAPSTGE